MSFLNKPVKTLEANVISVLGTESLPWFNPLNFPVTGTTQPTPTDKSYRWKIEMSVSSQSQSSYLTRNPGVYNGYDVSVGQWVANATTGQAWQIISIESKTAGTVTAIVQDIYRYNTFRDSSQVGNGSPGLGTSIIFSLSDDGLPQIDPVPAAGISTTFTQNLISRFTYINLQYDYPLYQPNNTFAVNDVIAVDSVTNTFVLADDIKKTLVGRVTSVSDVLPGWFTINPIGKIVDFLDNLPGNVGDKIYSSTIDPGELSLETTGSPIYIKLRNATPSTVTGSLVGPTTSGSIFSVNSINVTVEGTGSAQDLVDAVNVETEQTGVTAELSLSPSVVQTNPANITSTYGESALFAASTSLASASINGVTVTFTTRSTTPGYEDYAQPTQMVQDINNASIPNISAETINSGTGIKITNSTGGTITIVNISSDNAGVPFAGPNSASGLALSTPASTDSIVKFTAIDARPINFLDVQGSITSDFGLVSVENGEKAAGLYIVSTDGAGGEVGTGIAKTIETVITPTSEFSTQIGIAETGTRVTLITVEVTTAFDRNSSLIIGYNINDDGDITSVLDGLMTDAEIDLTTTGVYITKSPIMFGTDTVSGIVSITATYVSNEATVGSAKIKVSYV